MKDKLAGIISASNLVTKANINLRMLDSSLNSSQAELQVPLCRLQMLD
jgi:hypothetical protein